MFTSTLVLSVFYRLPASLVVSSGSPYSPTRLLPTCRQPSHVVAVHLTNHETSRGQVDSGRQEKYHETIIMVDFARRDCESY